MIFEDALKLLREGKKITHPYFEDDEYFVRCYHDLLGHFAEENGKRKVFITKMKGEYLHEDMKPNFDLWNPSVSNEELWKQKNSGASIPLILLTSKHWEEYLK